MGDAAKLQVYKCPACGGAARFDADTGRLACSWCGNAYDADQLEVHEIDPHLHGYLCPECGAQLMADTFIAAGTCPYCGNNQVAPHRFEGAFQPDYIIPFRITKQRAIDAYEESLTQRRYLPNDFVAQSRILSVQGAYVPFWLKDGILRFSYNYELTMKKDDGYYTSHPGRAGTYEFARVPADGSERMPDDMMDSVEPYDYDALLPFSTEYLPGFVAERYTVRPEEVDDRVDRRVKVSACRAAGDTLKDDVAEGAQFEYWNFVLEGSTANVERTGSAQALLPVWLIVVAYRNQKYLVGVNGQTGKVAVNLPIDHAKADREAAKQTLLEILQVYGTVLGFVVLVPCIVAAAMGKMDGLVQTVCSLPQLAEEPWMAVLLAVGVIVLVGGLAVYPYLKYKDTRKAIRDSMHNVSVASDADAYEPRGLTITRTWFA